MNLAQSLITLLLTFGLSASSGAGAVQTAPAVVAIPAAPVTPVASPIQPAPVDDLSNKICGKAWMEMHAGEKKNH